VADDVIPFYSPGSDLTCHAAVAITGKRFVHIAGNRAANGLIQVNHQASHVALGVARYTAALGKPVPVITEQDTVVPVTLGASLAAGVSVTSDAQGRAIAAAAGAPAAGILVTAGVNGADGQVLLRPHTAPA
jgi:hypothetical protein